MPLDLGRRAPRVAGESARVSVTPVILSPVEAEELKRKNRRQSLVLAAAVLAGIVLLAFLFRWLGWEGGYTEHPFRRSEYLLDDVVTLVLYGRDRGAVEEAAEAAFAEMRRLEGIFNRHDPSSELARVNREAHAAPLRVSPELFEVLRMSKEIHVSTSGAFDVTLGALIDLWDVVGRRERGEGPPGKEEILESLGRCGDEYLLLDEAEGTVFLAREGVILDLGGVAKGYAADAALRILRERGLGSGIIDMVSTMRVFGNKPREAGGPDWRVAVMHPREEGENLGILTLRGDSALSTSGDYQRCFEYAGERYHHIFDPRTGYPARSSMSCTVLDTQAGERAGAEMDALSTALFVMGYPEAVEWAGSRGLEVALVDEEGQLRATPGMENLLKETSTEITP